MPSINEYLLKEYNAKLLSAPDAEGVAEVEIYDPEIDMTSKKKINVRQLMADEVKEAGLPEDVMSKMRLTDANLPLPEAGLSFGQQTEFAGIKKSTDKFNYLTKQFGPNRVKPRKDGGFSVQGEDGEWRDADSGFFASLTSDFPTIAASIMGAKVGATAGTVVAPGVGTIAGGALGAFVGAIGGEALSYAEARAKGIRSEEDLDALAIELGKEGLLAATGEVIFPAAKIGALAIKESAKKLINKGAGLVEKPLAQQLFAEVGAAASNVPKEDLLLQFQHAEKAQKLYDKEVEFMLKKLGPENAAKLRAGANDAIEIQAKSPGWIEAKDKFISSVFEARDQALKTYGQDTAQIRAQMGPAKVDLDTFQQSILGMENAFVQAGLAERVVTGEGTKSLLKWKKPTKEGMQLLGQQFTKTKDFNQLQRVFNEVQALQMGAEKGVVGFDELVQAGRKLNQMLDTSGLLKGSELEISDAAGRLIAIARESIDQATTGLVRKRLGRQGVEMFRQMQRRYSEQAALIESIAKKFEPQNVNNTLTKLTNKELSGDNYLREDVVKLLRNAGKNPNDVLLDLDLYKAVQPTLNFIRQGRTASDLPGIAGIVTSPFGPKVVGWATRKAGLAQIQKEAGIVHLLQNMPAKQKEQLFSNPDAMRMFMQTATQAWDQREQMSQQMSQEVMKGVASGQ